LLERGDGYFAKLIKENGPDFENKMRYLANHKEIENNEDDEESEISLVKASE